MSGVFDDEVLQEASPSSAPSAAAAAKTSSVKRQLLPPPPPSDENSRNLPAGRPSSSPSSSGGGSEVAVGREGPPGSPLRGRADHADHADAAGAAGRSGGAPGGGGEGDITAAASSEEAARCGNRSHQQQLENSSHQQQLENRSHQQQLENSCSCSCNETRSNKRFKAGPRALSSVFKFRRTNDEVHTTISLEPVVCVFVDTPEVQRLRFLKQLGASEHVYMSCDHSRFAHSLGVAHLGCQMVLSVKEDQDQLDITERDVACVKLAGLFHDLGHGPYSHTFEDFYKVFLVQHVEANPHLRDVYGEGGAVIPDPPGPDWSHENMSLVMVDGALRYRGLEIDLDNLDAPLRQVDVGTTDSAATAIDAATLRVGKHCDGEVLTSRDFVFVKELIWGGPVPEIERALGGGFHGRTGQKQWMYDVVNNSHTGVDVDKMDYFARDERRAMGEAGKVDKLMIEDACVAYGECTIVGCKREHRTNKDGKKVHLMICYPEKRVSACIDFFKKRFSLHTAVYKHAVGDAAGFMICDILCQADPYFRMPVRNGFNGRNGQPKREYDSLPLSRAMLEPSVFLRLRDSILDVIGETTDPRLEPARKLIDDYRSRKFYKYAALVELDLKDEGLRLLWQKSEREIKEEMISIRGEHDGGQNKLSMQDFILEKLTIHYGSRDKPFLQRMRFVPNGFRANLRKPVDELPEAVRVSEDKYEAQLPKKYQECSLRVFCRDHSKTDLVRHVLHQYVVEAKGECLVTAGCDNDEGGSGRQYSAVLSQDDECVGLYDDRYCSGGGRGSTGSYFSNNSNNEVSPVPQRGASSSDDGTSHITPTRHGELPTKRRL